MAHECPECGMTCHCSGDIDDICFGYPDHYCSHCEEEDDDDDDDYDDWDDNDHPLNPPAKTDIE